MGEGYIHSWVEWVDVEQGKGRVIAGEGREGGEVCERRDGRQGAACAALRNALGSAE